MFETTAPLFLFLLVEILLDGCAVGERFYIYDL
jgi:hypothetical protein